MVLRSQTRCPTANTKRYIDFAAANGIGGVLVEGWNKGWDGDWIQNANAFSFTEATGLRPTRDVRYAKSKGVKLIVHNETSGGTENYERQLEDAFTPLSIARQSERSQRATSPT